MAGQLPFIPQGFALQGPRGHQTSGGVTLTSEHDRTCPYAGTDIPFAPIDISMHTDAETLRRALRRLLPALLESSGCNCGLDIPPTPALEAILNTSRAPRQAMPFTIRATQPWGTFSSISSPPAQGERMQDVDHGDLSASQHAHAETQLPPPWMDTPSQQVRSVPNSPPQITRSNTPVALRPTPTRRPMPALPQRPATPVAYAPATPNTTRQLTGLQGVEDLLAHMNQIITSTNANVHAVLTKCSNLDNAYTGIVNKFTHLFQAQDQRFESLEKQLLNLREQNKELKDKILNTPRAPAPALPRPIIPLPPKPSPVKLTKADKGKGVDRTGREPKTSAPAQPAPAPTRAPPVHPNRAPAASPVIPTTTTTTTSTTRVPRAAAQGPKKYVAPQPGVDDTNDDEEISSPQTAPVTPSWATVTSRRAKQALKNDVPKRAP